MAHIVARLCGNDVAVDVLGGAAENPGLSVVHYASSIEDTIDWIDDPDNASALLITSRLFGSDVMARRPFIFVGHNRPSDGQVQVKHGC